MQNPWTAKNPFMSAWLSAANTVANTARGHAGAAAQRQVASFQSEAAKQVFGFWSAMLTPPFLAPTTPAPKKRRTRRRSA